MWSLVEEHGHRLLAVDVADRLRNERRNVQLHDLVVTLAALWQRRRVHDDHLLECRFLDALASGTVK